MRNDLSLYYSVPNLVGFRQEPTITEYLKVHILTHREVKQSWGDLCHRSTYDERWVWHTDKYHDWDYSWIMQLGFINYTYY